MKQILALKHNRLRNGEHFSFHKFALETITGEKSLTLGLAALRSEYARLFELEDAAMVAEVGSRTTKSIVEKDKLRDKTFNYLRGAVSLQLNSPDDASAKAAETLAHLLKSYKNLASRTYNDETALIVNLLQDLGKEPYLTAVETLGLAATVTLLKTQNSDFDAVYSQRTADSAAQGNVQPMTEVRPLLDAQYNKIISVINSLEEVNELVEQNEEKRDLLEGIIDTLNARIAKEKNLLALRGSSPAVKEDGEVETGTDDTQTEA